MLQLEKYLYFHIGNIDYLKTSDINFRKNLQ